MCRDLPKSLRQGTCSPSRPKILGGISGWQGLSGCPGWRAWFCCQADNSRKARTSFRSFPCKDLGIKERAHVSRGLIIADWQVDAATIFVPPLCSRNRKRGGGCKGRSYSLPPKKREGGRHLATALSEGGEPKIPPYGDNTATKRCHAHRKAVCLLSGSTERQNKSSAAGVLVTLIEAAPCEFNFHGVGACT